MHISAKWISGGHVTLATPPFRIINWVWDDPCWCSISLSLTWPTVHTDTRTDRQTDTQSENIISTRFILFPSRQFTLRLSFVPSSSRRKACFCRAGWTTVALQNRTRTVEEVVGSGRSAVRPTAASRRVLRASTTAVWWVIRRSAER